MLNLGTKIKLIRQARGMSQLELAKKTSIDNSRLSMIENGHVTPTEQQLSALQAALNWPSDEAIEAAFRALAGDAEACQRERRTATHSPTSSRAKFARR